MTKQHIGKVTAHSFESHMQSKLRVGVRTVIQPTHLESATGGDAVEQENKLLSLRVQC